MGFAPKRQFEIVCPARSAPLSILLTVVGGPWLCCLLKFDCMVALASCHSLFYPLTQAFPCFSTRFA